MAVAIPFRRCEHRPGVCSDYWDAAGQQVFINGSVASAVATVWPPGRNLQVWPTQVTRADSSATEVLSDHPNLNLFCVKTGSSCGDHLAPRQELASVALAGEVHRLELAVYRVARFALTCSQLQNIQPPDREPASRACLWPGQVAYTFISLA